MLIPILIIIGSIYTGWWLNGIFKRLFAEKTVQVLRGFHWSVAMLLLVSLILSSYKIYFRGFYTRELLIWSYLFSSMLVGGFGNQWVPYWLERNYHRFLFFLPLRSGLLLLIPFLGFVVLFNIYGNILADSDDIFYEDQTIRIERTFRGALGGTKPPTIFTKRGIFEYKQEEFSVPPQVFSGLYSIETEKQSPKHYVLKFHHGFNNSYESPFLVHLKLD
ncbi:MAG TPA: hypothetical protein DCS93_19655 [Microscillaceae bacterium]|nr:hypothetical protein [Microscillaceae bacterium]